MRRMLIVAALPVALAACAGGYVETLGPNAYRVTVEHRAESGAEESAEAEAERIADAHCGGGARSKRMETTSNDMSLNGRASSWAKVELTFKC